MSRKARNGGDLRRTRSTPFSCLVYRGGYTPQLNLNKVNNVPRSVRGQAIKAIETAYNGYLFRSRFEARWAVFFDALGLKYEYEKQGFDLGAAGPYLPDFWLPAWEAWVEIKPSSIEWPDDWKPCHFLAKESGQRVLLFFGQPWPREFAIVQFPICTRDMEGEVDWGEEGREYIVHGEGYEMDGRMWNQLADCRRCAGLVLLYTDEQGLPLAQTDIGPHTCGDHDRWSCGVDDHGVLNAAYRAARSARFEHGQTPRHR
jgi:hypothetical protein